MLHNVAKHLNDDWEAEDWIENAIDETEENVPVNIFDQNEMGIRCSGQQKRTHISN